MCIDNITGESIANNNAYFNK